MDLIFLTSNHQVQDQEAAEADGSAAVLEAAPKEAGNSSVTHSLYEWCKNVVCNLCVYINNLDNTYIWYL